MEPNYAFLTKEDLREILCLQLVYEIQPLELKPVERLVLRMKEEIEFLQGQLRG